MQAELVPQGLLYFLKFVLPQDAVIDEHAGQARLSLRVAHGSIHQHGSYRGIHSARERADGPPAAHLRFDLLHRRVDKVLGSPCGLGPANLKDKVFQNLRALRRVMHFRMELHRIPFLGNILNAGDGVVGLGHELKAGRQLQSFIPVRHPHGQLFRHALKQHRRRDHIHFRVPVFALLRGTHLPPQRVHHELQAVADAQHWDAELEHTCVRGRRIFVVHRPGRARKNDSHRPIALDLGQLGVTWQHDRKNILFPNTARDQLRVLCAKVQDDDALILQEIVRGWGFHE